MYEEIVNGTIIGAFTWPYEFWIKENRLEYQDKRGEPWRQIARGFFSSDEEAIAWFSQSFPVEYAKAIQMRVFCIGGKNEIQ